MIILALIFFFPPVIQAESNGISAGNFLKIPVGARETSLGGAFSPIADNSNSIFYNPAGLAYSKNAEISLSYNKYIEEIAQQTFSFSLPYKSSAFGIGVNYLSVPSFDAYDDNNIPIGRVKADDMALFFSYAGGIATNYKFFKNIYYGVNIKHISQKLDDKTAKGNAFDIGFLIETGLKGTKFSVVIDNIYSDRVKFINEKAKLDKIYKTGLSCNLLSDSRNKFLLSFEENFNDSGNKYFSAGFENIIYNVLHLRAGYNDRDDISNHFNFGFGILISKKLSFDYSSTETDYFGNIQKFSISYKFSSTNKNTAMKKDIHPLPTSDINVIYSDYNILNSTDTNQKIKTAYKIAENKNDETIRFLIKMANDTDNEAAITAAIILKNFKEPELIFELLKSRNENVKLLAIESLLKYKNEKVIKELEGLLQDSSPAIRLKTAQIIGAYGDKTLVNTLLSTLKTEKDEEVKTAIINSLNILAKEDENYENKQ